MRLIVYHTDEDDPKKCSAKKLARFGHVNLEANIRRTPKNAILLNPFSEKSLSKEDKREMGEKYRRICVMENTLDICTWISIILIVILISLALVTDA